MPFPQMPNLKFGLEDRAQKAIQVFYASLLDRLWTRQTMSSLARYNHLSIKDKGDWAKLKRIGWQILKITPYVGKVLKFTNSDDTPWISKLTKGLKYFKMGLKASKTASEILDYWDDFKQLSKGIDSYMRKWIEGNEVDTKTVYKQFANIFIIDEGKNELERFVYRLLDRYAAQLKLLGRDGAEALAEAIDCHLDRLFRSDFTRFDLGELDYRERQLKMLELMQNWVSQVEFIEEKSITLVSGKTITASALLQRSGLYFKGNEEDIKVDVIIDWDMESNTYLMTDANRYGCQKADSKQVKRFKKALIYWQKENSLFFTFQQHLTTEKTPEDLFILKELGTILKSNFEHRTLEIYRDMKEINAYPEVVWEPPIKVMQQNISQLKGAIKAAEGKTEKAEKNTIATKEAMVKMQEACDEKLNLMRQKVTILESQAETAKKLAKEEAVAANKAVTKMQANLGKANERIEKLEKAAANRDKIITALSGRLNNLEAQQGMVGVEEHLEKTVVDINANPTKAREGTKQILNTKEKIVLESFPQNISTSSEENPSIYICFSSPIPSFQSNKDDSSINNNQTKKVAEAEKQKHNFEKPNEPSVNNEIFKRFG